MKWFAHVSVIFVATALYSLASFAYSWSHTPPDLLLTIAGALIVPVLYGLAWFLSTRGDREVAVRALVASATWVGAAFLQLAAHYPPWAPEAGGASPNCN